MKFVFEETDHVKLISKSNVYINNLVHYVLRNFDEIVKSGIKDSDNVILKFNLSPTTDPHLRIHLSRISLNLYYKYNNEPLSNQIIYLIIGNKKSLM
ncbi:hypothetical protein ALNOE001_19330 [Candidatus Methanobinarius endosymbioticus]|uniref:Uncharacterized protein n=1 Tax=Candidatus Methanobinarius endosymbioticus TaxID=2006182 RepID=A0A366MAF1_9EURY|nr:hypothetical protein ALNOE001_19330 [Candidatus Methanobinarius endosymbioticus]